jgi:translation initiation factor IF-3
LIGEQGEQFGVVSTSEALHQANESGLDLVEVNPTGEPPVCKLVDFGKMQYEQEKKERKQKAKQKRIEIKGIRLSVAIADNDMQIRVKQAEKFLSKGDKVQIMLQLRGREKAHPDKAYDVINEYMKLLPKDKMNLEAPIKRQGGRFTCLIGPKN